MPQISATVNSVTIDAIREIAKKQNRSFSDMVDILLTQSVKKVKK